MAEGWEPTDKEILNSRLYEQWLNEKYSDFKAIGRLYARKLMEELDKPCTGHYTPSGKFKNMREIPRRNCEICWEQYKEI